MVFETVSGYGTSFDNAEVITNGTYVDISFPSGQDNAYYKIYCKRNNNLQVTLSDFGHPTFDLDLLIYDPFEDLVDSSSNIIATESCSESCDVSGHYYIRVEKDDCCGGSSGTTLFTLSISGASGSPGIPAFDILFVITGLLSTLGILLLISKQKKVKST